jgi:hypothetical protein
MDNIEDNISVPVDKSVIRQYHMLFFKVPARIKKITKILQCKSDKTITTGLVSWKLFLSNRKYGKNS